METHKDHYSQRVRWIKFILALVALGLLYSFFMNLRTVDLKSSIPITDISLRDRVQDLGVSNPIFFGVTDEQNHIKLHATYAHPVNGDMETFRAQDVIADVTLPSGLSIRLVSDLADVFQQKSIAQLSGNVIITTSTGYRLSTEFLETRFDTIFAKSLVPVTGTGPIGDIESNRMVVNSDAATGNAYVIFEGDVKVTYLPRNTGE